MKNEEIVRALRCVSTAGSSPDCEHCPYWMEESVPAEVRDMVGEDVWAAIGERPLFGHHSGKKSQTFWGCFMKLEDA